MLDKGSSDSDVPVGYKDMLANESLRCIQIVHLQGEKFFICRVDNPIEVRDLKEAPAQADTKTYLIKEEDLSEKEIAYVLNYMPAAAQVVDEVATDEVMQILKESSQ